MWVQQHFGTDTIILTYTAGATNHFNGFDVVEVVADVTQNESQRTPTETSPLLIEVIFAESRSTRAGSNNSFYGGPPDGVCMTSKRSRPASKTALHARSRGRPSGCRSS